MRSTSCLLLLLVAFASCRTNDPGLPPAKVRGMPWGAMPADQLCWGARQAAERGDAEGALRQLRAVLRDQPEHVEANRLRQDLLRVRGRRGLLWNEARARVAAAPGSAVAHYLLGRISEDPDAKLASFRRAATLQPDAVWPWLGLAHTLRATDRARALRIYRRLYEASGQHPLVAVAYAAALREAGRLDTALAVYQDLRTDRRMPGVGDLGLAQVALAQDQRDAAWAALLSALRQRPFDPGVQAMLAGWLETSATPDQVQQVLDVLREDGDRLRAFGAGAGAATLAELLRRDGQLAAARALLERRLVERPSAGVARELRRLLLATGDVVAFLQRVQVDVPRHVVDDEGNQLRARWLELLDGPFHDGEPLADVARARALLDALRGVGMLVEVEAIAGICALRFGSDAGVFEQRRDEARRELAFEAGLRRVLYRGYQQGDTASLSDVLDRIRELSRRVLGRDVVGEPDMFLAPLVGEMLDPFGGGLCAHLANYNRHLVLGRRAGGVAEGLLTTRLSVRELPAQAGLELAGRCYEVIGVDRDIRALGGVLGSDLAGVALLNHYLVDHDAVHDWAMGLLSRRRVARADDLVLQSDPLPEAAGLDPFDLSWRLTLAAPVSDDGLDAAVLQMIRAHERRHLVDSFRYLPLEWNLWRGIGLFVAYGGSPAAIEAEMERRAELAALALGEQPQLVLAHIADFYGDPPLRSPHHRGFSQLLRELHDELVRSGVAREAALPSRWHELPAATLAAAARHLLDELPR